MTARAALFAAVRVTLMILGFCPWTWGVSGARRRISRRLRPPSTTFPADVHTHSREQVFYVSDDGLIRRHDYIAEEFGTWAKSAHYWFEHAAFDGMIVPRKRRVLLRRSDGRSLSHPLLVWINVDDVSRVGTHTQPD